VGSTVVSNKYVRLTADTRSLKGALWNSVPVQLTDWEMQVQFKVHGHGRELNGDGFSIWYARDRMQIGDVFGSKDLFMGLAIILDTYNNHNGAHNVIIFLSLSISLTLYNNILFIAWTSLYISNG
jgi:mannose-binding lectin 2